MSIQQGLSIEDLRVKALFIGSPKSGKTRLAATFPKPIVFDFERGWPAHAVTHPDVKYGVYVDEKTTRPTAWSSFAKDYAIALKDPEVETLVFDTIGSMQEALLNRSLYALERKGQRDKIGMELRHPAREDWVYVMTVTRNIMEEAIASNKHVVVLSHENVEMREAPDGMGGTCQVESRITPDVVGKKDRMSLHKRFDIYGRLEPKVSNKSVEYRLRMKPTTKITFGARWDCFNEYEVPNFEILFAKVTKFAKEARLNKGTGHPNPA